MGEIRKGSHIMIKGHPCKVAEVSTSKTGKHGHAKAHIVALDLFTNKKYEDLCPTSHNVEVPFVNKTEYQLLSADADTGEVQLLTEGGETKEDKKTTAEILAAVDNGKENTCIVLSACGQEKI